MDGGANLFEFASSNTMSAINCDIIANTYKQAVIQGVPKKGGFRILYFMQCSESSVI